MFVLNTVDVNEFFLVDFESSVFVANTGSKKTLTEAVNVSLMKSLQVIWLCHLNFLQILKQHIRFVP
jgi:hypothetical protein